MHTLTIRRPSSREKIKLFRVPTGTAISLVANGVARFTPRSEEHTSELQSHSDLVCRLLLEKKKNQARQNTHDAVPPARGRVRLASGLGECRVARHKRPRPRIRHRAPPRRVEREHSLHMCLA